MSKWPWVVLMAALGAHCAQRVEEPARPAVVAQTQTVAPTPPPPPAPRAEENVASLAGGAVVISGPAWPLFDEDPTTGTNLRAPKPTIVELADRARIRRIEVDGEGDVTVETSDDGKHFARFNDKETEARYLCVSMKNADVRELRVLGERLTHNPPPALESAYETSRGTLHLDCPGTGSDGRLVATTWRGKPAVAMLSASGRIFGLTWVLPDRAEAFAGKRTKAKPCSSTLASELETKGRARIYGIHFEADSAAIRDESMAVLERIAEALNALPQAHVAIESHTDKDAEALSHARASAVMAHLAAHGVDAARLTAVARGAADALVSSDSPLGRAVNRRLELVTQ